MLTTRSSPPQNAIDGYVLGSGADGEGRVGPLDVAGTDNDDTAASAAAGGTQRAWTEWGLVFPVPAYHHNKCAVAATCFITFVYQTLPAAQCCMILACLADSMTPSDRCWAC